jgi:hypothetical protein
LLVPTLRRQRRDPESATQPVRSTGIGMPRGSQADGQQHLPGL